MTLAYGREMNSVEIARRTHVGRATARSRLRLGLGKLRADLDGGRQQLLEAPKEPGPAAAAGGVSSHCARVSDSR